MDTKEGVKAMDTNKLTLAPQTIESIVIGDNAQLATTVGKWGVTMIEAYDENGDGACVAWFNVWKGRTLYAKVNSRWVSAVYYALDEDEKF